MSLRERLDQELQEVAFSEKGQAELKRQLVLLARRRTTLRRIRVRLQQFWHGSVEVPLPVAATAVLVLGLGLASTCLDLFLVDQSTAALLLQAGSESLAVINRINQGVSVL